MFYFKLDTTALTDDEWAEAWNKLQFALKFDGDRYADLSGMSGKPKKSR